MTRVPHDPASIIARYVDTPANNERTLPAFFLPPRACWLVSVAFFSETALCACRFFPSECCFFPEDFRGFLMRTDARVRFSFCLFLRAASRMLLDFPGENSICVFPMLMFYILYNIVTDFLLYKNNKRFPFHNVFYLLKH